MAAAKERTSQPSARLSSPTMLQPHPPSLPALPPPLLPPEPPAPAPPLDAEDEFELLVSPIMPPAPALPPPLLPPEPPAPAPLLDAEDEVELLVPPIMPPAPALLLLVAPPAPPIPPRPPSSMKGMQLPPWQAPPWQAVPSGWDGVAHAPVCVSQVPATWHSSRAAHTVGLPPTHTPAWQASIVVHASPSLHGVPVSSAQVPFAGAPLAVEHAWHAPAAQAVLQQMPSTQNPLPQSAAVEHIAPFCLDNARISAVFVIEKAV
jgi:hypothetical protein